MLSGKQIAKTHRGRRHLENREGKLIENEKGVLLFKGAASSEIVKKALTDLNAMKKPSAKMLTKKNITRPFEDQSSVEFLCKANDTSLFIFGSHSKKRPHSLVFGRLFDFQLLNMLECQIDGNTFKSMDAFTAERSGVARPGSKPMFVFQGEDFDTNPDLTLFRSLMLDTFHGQYMPKVNLASLERVIICTSNKGKIHFRQYDCLKKKSGTKFPRVQLEEMGPRMDLTINRVKAGSDELLKEAMKVPRAATKKYQKNISEGTMGDKVGRLHVNQQDINTLGLAKTKALGKRKRSTGRYEQDAAEAASAGGDSGEMDTDNNNSSSKGNGSKKSSSKSNGSGSTADEFTHGGSYGTGGSDRGRSRERQDEQEKRIGGRSTERKKNVDDYGNKKKMRR